MVCSDLTRCWLHGVCNAHPQVKCRTVFVFFLFLLLGDGMPALKIESRNMPKTVTDFDFGPKIWNESNCVKNIMLQQLNIVIIVELTLDPTWTSSQKQPSLSIVSQLVLWSINCALGVSNSGGPSFFSLSFSSFLSPSFSFLGALIVSKCPLEAPMPQDATWHVSQLTQ